MKVLALISAALLLVGCPSTDPEPAALSRVQVIHALDGEPFVYVTANGTTTLASELPFGATTGYVQLSAGIQTLAVSNNGTDVWRTQDITTDPDSAYTFLVVGRSTPSGTSKAVALYSDIVEANPTQARVRFINAAYDLSQASVITNIGPAEYPIPGMQQVLYGATSVSPTTGSPFLNLPAGTYDLRFTADPSTTVIAQLPQMTFEAGMIYTLLLGGQQSTNSIQAFLLYHQPGVFE